MKKVLPLFLAFAMLCGMPVIPASAANSDEISEDTAAYAWYGDGNATEYIISTADELREFARIVNGAAVDENGETIVARDDFSGKTVKLDHDIQLAEDDLYEAIAGVAYGDGFWPLNTTQYVLAEAAPVWTPIGSGVGVTEDTVVTVSGNSFAGIFDGQNHTISGVYTGTKDAAAGNTDTVQGLFGIVTGTVKNITVSGCITGNSVIGGVAAYLNGGTVMNCVNNAIVFSDGGSIPGSGVEDGVPRAGATGGIVGLAAGVGSVTDCTNNGVVTCANSAQGGRVAGVIGLINAAADAVTVSRCANHGAVSGYQYVGGIVGLNAASDSPIDSCVNTAAIAGYGTQRVYAGGIVGQFACIVSNCYNTGDVRTNNDQVSKNDSMYFGGIAGSYVFGGTGANVINCYSLGAVTYTAAGEIASAGIVVGNGPQENCYYLDTALDMSGPEISSANSVGMTADEMKSIFFTAALGEAFGYVSGGYPVLKWQGGSAVYAAAVPVSPDYTVAAVEGYRAAVLAPGGDVFKFTVIPADNYEISVVKANGAALTADEDGAYAVTLDRNVIITVEGRYTSFTVTIPTGEGYTVTGMDPDTVACGGSFRFVVAADADYILNSVMAGTAVLSADANGVYTIENITENLSITINVSKNFSGGEFAEPVPATITTAEQLAQLAAEVNAGDTKRGMVYTLGNDIDISTYANWTPIGGEYKRSDLVITSNDHLNELLEKYFIIYDNAGHSYVRSSVKNEFWSADYTYYYLEGAAFGGTFDGAGYTIEGLTVDMDTGYAGLFGNVSGTVKNLTVKGSVTTSTSLDFAGGVVGKLSAGGLIENCVSYVDVTASNGYNIGGIAGIVGEPGVVVSNDNPMAIVRSCASYGDVNGYARVGGITGRNAGLVSGCANYGTIFNGSGSKRGTGGIVGMNGVNNAATDAGIITDCFNFGFVDANGGRWTGGIAGFQNGASTTSSCYNAGMLNTLYTYDGAAPEDNRRVDWANPIIGQNEGYAENCYWLNVDTGVLEGNYIGSDETGCGSANGGSQTNIVGMTEAEMKSAALVTALNGTDGTAWYADSADDPINNGYPILAWQVPGANAGFAVTLDDRTGTKTPAVITGLTSGSTYNGSVTFNVACDRACAVAYTTDGGATYIRLTATANAGGGYDFTVNVTGTMEIVVAIKGDANGDGTVNVSDSMLVNRSCLPDTHAAYRALDTWNLCLLDFNGDGAITVSDTMRIDRSCLPDTHVAYQALIW